MPESVGYEIFRCSINCIGKTMQCINMVDKISQQEMTNCCEQKNTIFAKYIFIAELFRVSSVYYTDMLLQTGQPDYQINPILEYLKQWLNSDMRLLQIQSQQYYDGIQDILAKRRTYVDEEGGTQEATHLPNSQIVYNLYHKIVDQKAAFISERRLKFILLPSHPVDYHDPNSVKKDTPGDVNPVEGYGITQVDGVYQIENRDANKERTIEKEFLSALDRLFNETWYEDVQNAIRYSIIDGEVWLHPCIDPETGDFCVYMFRGRDICPIYTDASHTRLYAVARWYEVQMPDAGKTPDQYVEVYQENYMTRFKVQMGQTGGGIQPIPTALTDPIISQYIHYYDAARAPMPGHLTYRWEAGIPFIRIAISHDRPARPLLARCKSEQDALNDVYSNWTDNMKTYPDQGILVVQNADGTDVESLWGSIQRNRALVLTSTSEMPGAEAKYLENPLQAEAYEKYIADMRARMFEVCKGYDETSALSGNLHDLSLRTSQMSMEEDANVHIQSLEAGFTTLIQDFYIPYLRMKGFTDFADVRIGVKVDEARIQNIVELVNLMVSMRLKLSQRCMLEHLPWVKNVDEELDRQRQDRNLELMYEALKIKQQQELQMQQQERMMKMQAQYAPANPQGNGSQSAGGNGGGNGGGGTSGVDRSKQIGASPTGGVDTGSPKGGGKAADFSRAAERKAVRDRSPIGNVQPQR